MSRGKWWLVALAALVAVVVQIGAGVLVWQHTRPRLPALAPVTATLDRAIATVVAAVGDSAAVALTGLVPTAACERSFLAKGHVYTRTADLYTDSDQEGAVITAIAGALPGDEHPQAGSGAGAPLLSAQLGGGIHLEVTEIDQGWIAATALTDCRTGAPAPDSTATPATATSSVSWLLAALGTAPAGWHADAVACPSGRSVTVDAISQPTDTDSLPARFGVLVPVGARRFNSPANRLAWRDNDSSTIVAASDDGTHITVQQTTSC